jgi:hypothetical protein
MTRYIKSCLLTFFLLDRGGVWACVGQEEKGIMMYRYEC